jgi:hypothetical protein
VNDPPELSIVAVICEATTVPPLSLHSTLEIVTVRQEACYAVGENLLFSKVKVVDTPAGTKKSCRLYTAPDL